MKINICDGKVVKLIKFCRNGVWLNNFNGFAFSR